MIVDSIKNGLIFKYNITNYIMSTITLRDHVEQMRSDETISTKSILRVYKRLNDTVATAVFNPIMTDDIHRIYLDATPRSIVIDDEKTVHIRKRGGVYLERGADDEYSYDVYKSWDAPFFERIFDSDTLENIQLWSPEMLLMRYIAERFRKGQTKPKNSTWIADWAKADSTKELLTSQICILWYALPRMLNYIEHSSTYRAFERKLVVATRLLYNASSKRRYSICSKLPKLRTFVDALKTRVHLPMLYGRFVVCVMTACNYKKSEVKALVDKPTTAPTILKDMLVFFWFQLLSPWDV